MIIQVPLNTEQVFGKEGFFNEGRLYLLQLLDLCLNNDAVQSSEEKTELLDENFMRQFREKIDDRPMYEVFSSHPKFEGKFSKEEFFDAHSAVSITKLTYSMPLSSFQCSKLMKGLACTERQVQSLFLKPRKTSPSAFKLYEHYLDHLLLDKERQAVRTLIHK